METFERIRSACLSYPKNVYITRSTSGILVYMTEPRIYTIKFSGVYPLYVAKAQKKERTKKEVDEIIRWLTGYSQDQLEKHMAGEASLEDFFLSAPRLHPLRRQITGVICGMRVEEIEDPLTQEIRYMDKLIDELARGKSMEKIIRTEKEKV